MLALRVLRLWLVVLGVDNHGSLSLALHFRGNATWHRQEPVAIAEEAEEHDEYDRQLEDQQTEQEEREASPSAYEGSQHFLSQATASEGSAANRRAPSDTTGAAANATEAVQAEPAADAAPAGPVSADSPAPTGNIAAEGGQEQRQGTFKDGVQPVEPLEAAPAAAPPPPKQAAVEVVNVFAPPGPMSPETAVVKPYPCPCATTPPPLLNIRPFEERHVIGAINEAIAEGQVELQAAARGESGAFAYQLNNVSNPEVLVNRTQPILSRISGSQVNSTKGGIAAAHMAFKAEQWQINSLERTDEVLNRMAINRSAGEYALADAYNAISNASKKALSATFHEEQDAEQFRLETMEFSRASLLAANQSLQIAREAQELMYKVPWDQALKAEAFMHQMLQQAWQLRDEAIKGESLSTMSWEVAEQAHNIAGSSLHIAQDAEVSSQKAMSESQENARMLSELHARAEDVMISRSQIQARQLQS
eukprot:TRINITY_DN101420_c0_g1_i1.p1 TRINITY_DN101420_c0_g1~~TRINITY_DN101420_c0_g1_i1.p1  ORF type:complete len:478 (+),score=131.65 TRINITY_DN101420_c0_g1_i1:71-1504(+)